MKSLPLRSVPPAPSGLPLPGPVPARPRRAVAFCCDDRYLPYALFAASQIAGQAPQRDFDICLCGTEKPVIPDSLAGLGLRAIALAPEPALAGFGLDARRSESAYHRLLLPGQLAADYDRILYLDSDIFVQGGDIAALLGADLGGHAVAAVRDNPQWRTPGRMPEEFRTFRLGPARYLNSGVLLIDVPRWQKLGLTERMLAFGQSRGGQLKRHDQTLLNCVLHGDWAELSPKWNWQYSRAARLHEAMLGANIVHFIGPEKPWNAPAGALPPRFGAELSRFLRQHFPQRATALPPEGTGPGSRKMLSMLLRHLLNRRKMARYLARFPTDLTLRP